MGKDKAKDKGKTSYISRLIKSSARSISWLFMLKNLKKTVLWPYKTLNRHWAFVKTTAKSEMLLDDTKLDAQLCKKNEEFQKSYQRHVKSALSWAIYSIVALVVLATMEYEVFATLGLLALMVVCIFRSAVDLYIASKASKAITQPVSEGL